MEHHYYMVIYKSESKMLLGCSKKTLEDAKHAGRHWQPRPPGYLHVQLDDDLNLITAEIIKE